MRPSALRSGLPYRSLRLLNSFPTLQAPGLLRGEIRLVYLPVRKREIRSFFIAVASVDHLTNANRNRELRSVRESHQDFFPELGAFINRQFGNELADNLWEFKFWI